PTQTGRHHTFSIKGNTGVSAQQLFLCTENIVMYVVDKTYGNPMTVGRHPASA
ncbi:hypothetical protein DL93DRAFT_2091696, partial [Clavulina sp. PMI_390]